VFEVRDEVPLSEERLRLDYLLIRKRLDASTCGRAETLRALWPRLPLVTIAEFKSIGRPYRKGNLDRLWGYVHLYCGDELNGIEERAALCALLLVTVRTPTLDADTVAMGLEWCDLGGGYWELQGGLFRLYVVEIDVVAEHEDDDLLRLFGHGKERTPEARRFWAEQVGTKEAMMALHDLEGYDEVVQRFLELIPPEQRLAGLAPEQRLAGLPPEQVLLALPDEALRALPESYLATLPDSIQAAIHQRRRR
jgi:hypothetical protein